MRRTRYLANRRYSADQVGALRGCFQRWLCTTAYTGAQYKEDALQVVRRAWRVAGSSAALVCRQAVSRSFVSRSARGEVREQAIVLRLDDCVTLADAGLQLRAIDDRDVSTPVRDKSRLLQ